MTELKLTLEVPGLDRIVTALEALASNNGAPAAPAEETPLEVVKKKTRKKVVKKKEAPAKEEPKDEKPGDSEIGEVQDLARELVKQTDTKTLQKVLLSCDAGKISECPTSEKLAEVRKAIEEKIEATGEQQSEDLL